MSRRRCRQRQAMSSKQRVQMYRQRKKARDAFRQTEQHLLDQSAGHDEASPIEVDESLLKKKIRDWSNKYRIAKRAIDDLLAILTSSGVESLPKNHRTLQKTPTNIALNEISGGHQWHNALGKSLRRIFNDLDRNIRISLNINIDGLPLYNSSGITFYPILASIHGMHKSKMNFIIFD